MNGKKVLIGIMAAFIISGGFLVTKLLAANKKDELVTVNGEKAIVYKTPNCGCCVGHAVYLTNQGYEVETVLVDEMSDIKNEHNIPGNMQSCHTTLIGDYFVEGHMPIEAIDKLLEEKPDTDGIALPDMPAGSPGMPGFKTEEFLIYSLKDGIASEFMKI